MIAFYNLEKTNGASNQQDCLCWSSNIIHVLWHKSRRKGVGYEGEARKHDSPHYGTGGLVCCGECVRRWDGYFIIITPCYTDIWNRRTICTVRRYSRYPGFRDIYLCTGWL